LEFKDRLKMLREEKGMTQEELARRVGLEERSTISHWEKGRQGPSRDLLVKLSQIFEVPNDYLEVNFLNPPSIKFRTIMLQYLLGFNISTVLAVNPSNKKGFLFILTE